MNGSNCVVLLSRLATQSVYNICTADMATGQTKALVKGNTQTAVSSCGHFCALGVL